MATFRRSDFPVTQEEIDFLLQFISEQLQLRPGPARQWFAEHELDASQIGWLAIAMSKARIDIPLGLMIAELPHMKTTPESFLIPWKGRTEFLGRVREIRAWIDRHNQIPSQTISLLRNRRPQK